MLIFLTSTLRWAEQLCRGATLPTSYSKSPRVDFQIARVVRATPVWLGEPYLANYSLVTVFMHSLFSKFQ